MSKNSSKDLNLEPAAGNGLLHRRVFLSRSAAMVGGLGLLSAQASKADTLEVPPWMLEPGAHMSGYGQRSEYEQGTQRIIGSPPGLIGNGVSFTPLEKLHGTITPNSLHFERHHSGVPNINPDEHRLLIHGLVSRPLVFTIDDLMRYPTVTKTQFLECSGNSRGNLVEPTPQQAPLGVLHGLVSCSEWTGVPLSVLMEEAGVNPEGRWVLAEGADAAAMSRSIPLEKIMDDAIIALYQNGERLRPGNGYPMRLFLPGWEGNMSVKWLRRLKVNTGPTMTRDETSHYTDVLANGRSRIFTFPMGVKSIITSPSVGLNLNSGPGVYEIIGLAWSGAGRITRVEVSADNGNTWAEAAISGPALDKSLTRFRMAWNWNGGSAILKSRAFDETGAEQPLREELISEYGQPRNYHNNAIQAWSIEAANGEVTNVYA
tara:strand:- start:2382 stop:3671 length:1290 start_codon:yes stop_codon:yes gene_type:complete